MRVSRETLYHRETARIVAKSRLTRLKVKYYEIKKKSTRKEDFVGAFLLYSVAHSGFLDICE